MASLIEAIERAHAAIRPQVPVSPLAHSPALSAALGCDLHLKCEHLQPTGSFKVRGATNKILRLGETARRAGVVTASTGNHGLALAWAGRRARAPVTVYAAASSAPSKLKAIDDLGAELVTLDASALEVEIEARRRASLTGRTYVSPYNDLDVIAGQGTLGMELMAQQPGLDAVFICVGGGGLIGGAGTAVKALRPEAEIVGCWPVNSPCMARALEAGKIVATAEFETLSDGSAGGVEPGAVTLAICQAVVGRTVLVSEAEIRSAMRLVAEAECWMIEGSAAVAMAALVQQAEAFRGAQVAVVLCGRNIALDRFLAAVA